VLEVPDGPCFALACPHETEAHGSLYASLFGGPLRADEELSATCRLRLREGHGPSTWEELRVDFLGGQP